MGEAEKSPGALPLRLTFVISAYNTAQRMIRFADEKANFALWVALIVMTVAG